MKLVKKSTFVADSTQQCILERMSYAASKLWNIGNYEKHNYKEMGMTSFPNWHDQSKSMKQNYWFRALPSHSSQKVLRKLHESWKSFFTLVKAGGVENPQPPHYKKNGIFIPFDATTAVKREEDDVFRFTITKQERQFLREKHGIEEKFLRIKFPYFHDIDNIKEVTLYPGKKNEWTAIAVYEIPDVDLLPDNGRYLSIDLGVKNFSTIYTSDGESFILGKQFLELNHYFNKQVAHYQSISDAQQAASGVKYPKKSKRVLSLHQKYKNCVNDLLHKNSAYIRDYCVSHNINTVIVGDLTGIREDNDMGHKNNQALHALPYKKFVDKLSYKLAFAGITLIRQNEAYSSQCSPLAPKVSKEYAQPKQRIFRGLYKDGKAIFNADSVGAYNILRLAIPDKAFPVPYSTTKVSA